MLPQSQALGAGEQQRSWVDEGENGSPLLTEVLHRRFAGRTVKVRMAWHKHKRATGQASPMPIVCIHGPVNA